MTITNAQYKRMAATSNLIGEHLAAATDQDAWLWLAQARRILVAEADSIGTPGLLEQLDSIDHALDIAETRRADIRSAH
jgi:hypothetical protein